MKGVPTAFDANPIADVIGQDHVERGEEDIVEKVIDASKFEAVLPGNEESILDVAVEHELASSNS